jgi:hypothetical protein
VACKLHLENYKYNALCSVRTLRSFIMNSMQRSFIMNSRRAYSEIWLMLVVVTGMTLWLVSQPSVTMPLVQGYAQPMPRLADKVEVAEVVDRDALKEPSGWLRAEGEAPPVKRQRWVF